MRYVNKFRADLQLAPGGAAAAPALALALFLLIGGRFLMYHAGPFALWRKLAIRGKALPPAPGFIQPSAMRAFLFCRQDVDIFANFPLR